MSSLPQVPQQAQLDLPPISLARYLDLVKRKRWQVVPISLLGLIIGGVVAFLIPRFYVCEAVLSHQGLVLDTRQRTTEDPLSPLVDAAVFTVPDSVPSVLELLGWPEAKDEDLGRREAFVRDVQTRVKVTRAGSGISADDRGYVNLRIRYSDTDGARCFDFTRTLADTWRSEQVRDVRSKASLELEEVNNRIRTKTQARDGTLRELYQHAAVHGINLEDLAKGQELQESLRSRRLGEMTKRSEQLETELAKRNVELDALKTRLASGEVQPTRTVPDVVVLDPVVEAAMAVKVQEYQNAVRMLETQITPLHQDYETYAAIRDALKGEVEEYLASKTGQKTKQVPNEEWELLKRQIADAEAAIAADEAEVEELTTGIDALETEIEGLGRVFEVIALLRAQLQKIDRDLIALEQAEREKQARFDLVNVGEPIRLMRKAQLPEVPTEPNITLVALLGCAIGLGLAIALILLWDFLQSTFKTLDDVERGLTLPVLGMLSHLETREERVAAVAHRRRVSIVAGAFLVLCLSVVTIYYVAPTRLPPAVFDALDVILGSAR